VYCTLSQLCGSFHYAQKVFKSINTVSATFGEFVWLATWIYQALLFFVRMGQQGQKKITT
jgi:hypothetical protein